MLSKEEKEEFIRDGLNPDRRESFRELKYARKDIDPSLDSYMQFLSTVQNAFNCAVPSFKRPDIRSHRL